MSDKTSRAGSGAEELGGELFQTQAARAAVSAGGNGGVTSGVPSRGKSPLGPIERTAPVAVGTGWGKGPVPVDTRKFRYDVLRGRSTAPLSFSASKADRMDAAEAGELLHKIHTMFGIERAEEQRILAFDKALFFEHTINGASLMQPGRGSLTVDGMQFDIQPIKRMLGVDQRRFFRAYADNVAEVNREVLESYDMYDPVSAEKVGQIHQLAAERGLQKFPHLVHDSSDACSALTYDERVAIMASKRVVLESTFNQADAMMADRPSAMAGRRVE